MDISVIIPTRNEEENIATAINSIKTDMKIEVIVVDTASDDKTCQIAAALGAKIIEEPRRGWGVAKNTGAKNASGNFLFFLDADSQFLNPLDYYLSFFNSNTDAIYGVLHPIESGLINEFMFVLTTNIIPRITSKFNFHVGQASCQAFRRSFFEEIGGFDENLVVLEDNEILNRKPSKVKFVPKFVVRGSARRFKRDGYVKSTILFLRGYWNCYIDRRMCFG